MLHSTLKHSPSLNRFNSFRSSTMSPVVSAGEFDNAKAGSLSAPDELSQEQDLYWSSVDHSLASRQRAELASCTRGQPGPEFVGAYGWTLDYDELAIPVEPAPQYQYQETIDHYSKACLSPHRDKPIALNGSHTCRLELSSSGAFRARLLHDAVGPACEQRSVHLEATGTWGYLPGAGRLVMMPSDPATRIDVAVLSVGGPRDDDGGSPRSKPASSPGSPASQRALPQQSTRGGSGVAVQVHLSKAVVMDGKRYWKTLIYPAMKIEAQGQSGGSPQLRQASSRSVPNNSKQPHRTGWS